MEESRTRREFCRAVAALSAEMAFGASDSETKSMPFKLGIITDEISEDLETALQFMRGYSLSWCELRSIGGKNIMALSAAELERARQIVARHRFRVAAIGSPIFKWNLPEMPARPSQKRDTFEAHFTEDNAEDLLKSAFGTARLFGTDKVRIFSYWRVDDPGKAYPHVVRRLKKAASAAAQNKLLLVLENEFACNVGTGKELGRILRDVDSPWLRGNWDPGNAVALNEVPFTNGYNAVRGLFRHMHVKDAVRNSQTGETRWMPVGSGTVDWKGQFRALIADGYRDTMSLETHYRRPDGNKLESTRESLEGLLKVWKSVSQPG